MIYYFKNLNMLNINTEIIGFGHLVTDHKLTKFPLTKKGTYSIFLQFYSAYLTGS